MRPEYPQRLPRANLQPSKQGIYCQRVHVKFQDGHERMLSNVWLRACNGMNGQTGWEVMSSDGRMCTFIPMRAVLWIDWRIPESEGGYEGGDAMPHEG